MRGAGPAGAGLDGQIGDRGDRAGVPWRAMPAPSTFALFAAAALALLVVPGPAVLYIVTRSIDQGRRAGMASVAGIHTGSVVHVAAAAVGLSAVLAASATAFTVLKLVGAAYLIGLGVQKLRANPAASSNPLLDEPRIVGLRRTYAQGVLVNVLNPKTALFFLAFLPQFVDPERGSTTVQVVALGLTFIALGIVSDGAYALLAGSLGERLRRSARFARLRDRTSGVVYIALGLAAAKTSPSSTS
jgi:threonine/homoserine/homoserine lactone efflux protein